MSKKLPKHIKLANQVAKGSTPKAITLLKLEADREAGYVLKKENKVSFEVKVSRLESNEPKLLGLVPECLMNIFSSGDKDNPKVSIKISYLIEIILDKNISSYSEEELTSFASVNGSLLSWPFFREILHNTLIRMGIQQIPIINFLLADQIRPPDNIEAENI